jgi:hypothetical protein
MDNKTFSVLDKLIKIFSQKGNITPDEIQELKDYLIETNIVDSDEDADSWIRNYLNKKYPEVKILKLEETLNPQNMTNEQLRMQFLSGVITESEYKVKLEELNSTEKKDSLNEHYIAGGIVGVGAINNPFEGRKKESYEDAFEYFLSSKYSLKEEEKIEEAEGMSGKDFALQKIKPYLEKEGYKIGFFNDVSSIPISKMKDDPTLAALALDSREDITIVIPNDDKGQKILFTSTSDGELIKDLDLKNHFNLNKRFYGDGLGLYLMKK